MITRTDPSRALVSVALAVHRGEADLRSAAASILSQTHADLDLMLILNGSDEATTQAAHDISRADLRARVLSLPKPGLAAALNLGLREAKSDLVARMDADDWCHPERIERQVRAIAEMPRTIALGTAYEIEDADGRIAFTVRPPRDPREVRWRLLLANLFAHGSMLLRRDAVVAAGGYDEACDRAQDYDLWLRLSGRADVCAVQDVLYRYRTRQKSDPARSTARQSEIAVDRLLAAWRQLPGRAEDDKPLRDAMVRAMTHGDDPAQSLLPLEGLLTTHGPTRESLLALLWARALAPSADRLAADAARRALVRERTREMRDAGCEGFYLWGAGDHTRRLLENPGDFAIPLLGIADDNLGGMERHGRAVIHPREIPDGGAALLSSDWHEARLWEASAPARARGVRVFRLYGTP